MQLPTIAMIEEQVAAWSNRDWISMLFICRPSFQVVADVRMISATHHGDGSIKFEEMHGVPLHKIQLALPQFYTLFWQYVEPQVYPK